MLAYLNREVHFHKEKQRQTERPAAEKQFMKTFS